MTFAELATQLRQTTMEALDAQEFPLSLLVERLQPDRGAGGTPLFDTFFVLQRFDQYKHLQTLLGGETDAEPVMLGGLSLTPYPLTQTSAQFDLALQLVEVGDSIRGAFWYSTEIFDRSTAEAFAADYVRLLEEISTDSHIALGALTPPSGTKSLDPAVTALIAELEARDVQISAGGRQAAPQRAERRAGRCAEGEAERPSRWTPSGAASQGGPTARPAAFHRCPRAAGPSCPSPSAACGSWSRWTPVLFGTTSAAASG